ncbi:MAG: hypothetical protein H6907_10365 [Hyphomicrobiales bacterium]|nr:hypothetical protein [Hyphomicrobiales bacterium]MCP5372123.1 hypothetical protein [Hyphomicrobiales bacterium]
MSIYVPRQRSRLAEAVAMLAANLWHDSQAQRAWQRFDRWMYQSHPHRVIRRFLKSRFAGGESWPHRRPGL